PCASPSPVPPVRPVRLCARSSRHIFSPLARSPHLSPTFFFHCYADPRDLHSFPTRRSSDLSGPGSRAGAPPQPARPPAPGLRPGDRKSTRLNSSHVKISYAVFCLKKKNHAAKRPSPATTTAQQVPHKLSTGVTHMPPAIEGK